MSHARRGGLIGKESMHRVVGALLLFLTSLEAFAAQDVVCALEQSGDEAVMRVRAEPDALGGSWKEMNKFRVRALLAAPAARSPWLLVEVYARSADGDHRIISSQKVYAPFVTGRMEVVEPDLGRSLRYECAAAQ